MKVTESGFKNRQLHMEDYLQMVSAEQKEYAEVFDYSKITEKSGVITDYWTNNLFYSNPPFKKALYFPFRYAIVKISQ